jgi:hypothetical protein
VPTVKTKCSLTDRPTPRRSTRLNALGSREEKADSSNFPSTTTDAPGASRANTRVPAIVSDRKPTSPLSGNEKSPPRKTATPTTNVTQTTSGYQSKSKGDSSLPAFPSSVGGFFQAVGIGLTVAFGGLVFAISFATLVYDGPDAPAGAIAAGASFVLFGGAATALVVAARSGLPAIAEVQDGPSAIFAVMAAAIYSTDGIDETAKLPTLEAAIILTTVTTGVLMNLLGKYELGNLVRLLPSPVDGRLPRRDGVRPHLWRVQGVIRGKRADD